MRTREYSALLLTLTAPLLAIGCARDKVSIPPTCDTMARLGEHEGEVTRLLGSVIRDDKGSFSIATNCQRPNRLALRWRSGVVWTPPDPAGGAYPLLIVTGVITRDDQIGGTGWRIEATGYEQAPML